MLKILRHKGVAKRVLWVVAVIIIISFGFFGPSYVIRDSKKPTYAGKIFGKKISLDDYDYHFRQTRLQAMLQYGPDFDKVVPPASLYSQTWDRIILLHEVDRRKLRVADQEVVQTIENNPLFFRNGSFDKNVYQFRLLNNFRMKPREFEEGVRDTVKFIKLFDEETKNVSVPEDEIFESYKLNNEKVQVSYALVTPEKYLDRVTFDEVQAKNYFLTNREQFMLPPMIQVEYIQVAFPAEENTGTPAADNTAAPSSPVNAEENSSAEPVVSDAAKDHSYKKAQDVLAQLQENPNFATAAQMFQLQAKTTGFFSMEEPDLSHGWSFPLIQGLFELDTEQIVGPFETKDGYQIIRVKERRPAILPDYNQAQEEIKTRWMHSEAMKIARTEAEAARAKIVADLASNANPNFTQSVKILGLRLEQTPLFTRGQYLPTVGLSREFQEQAFGLTEDERLSEIAETDKGYGILWLDARKPVEQADFDKEEADYRQALLQDRKNALFSEFLSRLRLTANLEDHIPEIMGLNKSTPPPEEIPTE